MFNIKNMSLISKVIRLAFCRGQLQANGFLYRCSSKKSGDKKDGSSGGGRNKHDNDLCPYCLCCNCPCGTDPCASMYDSRKYGHCLPGNNRKPDFELLPKIPSDIFRCTVGERLGPQGQAHKCCLYQNPEYFSFHHMTYYDMHLVLRSYRRPSAKTNRKPV